jgi:hypothetical protein
LQYFDFPCMVIFRRKNICGISPENCVVCSFKLEKDPIFRICAIRMDLRKKYRLCPVRKEVILRWNFHKTIWIKREAIFKYFHWSFSCIQKLIIIHIMQTYHNHQHTEKKIHKTFLISNLKFSSKKFWLWKKKMITIFCYSFTLGKLI